MTLLPVERTGREVAHLFETQSGRSISYGTLYATLRRLREAGWARVRERLRGDRRERLFELTDDGRLALERGRRYFRNLAEFGRRSTPDEDSR